MPSPELSPADVAAAAAARANARARSRSAASCAASTAFRSRAAASSSADLVMSSGRSSRLSPVGSGSGAFEERGERGASFFGSPSDPGDDLASSPPSLSDLTSPPAATSPPLSDGGAAASEPSRLTSTDREGELGAATED